jgi:hypothetical protein
MTDVGIIGIKMFFDVHDFEFAILIILCYLSMSSLMNQFMQKKHSTQLPRDSAGRQLVKEALAGYGRANEFIEEEELRRNLPKMTENESRQEYEELCSVWEHTRKHYPDPKGEAILDQLHIQYLVERRRLWDKIGQGLAKRKQENAANL